MCGMEILSLCLCRSEERVERCSLVQSYLYRILICIKLFLWELQSHKLGFSLFYEAFSEN